MIERVSRYYDGPLAQTVDKNTGNYVISVYRKFPTSQSVRYITYIWKDGDSLSSLAEQYGAGAKYWWEIMDINPEIMEPFSIEPGTTLRVPYGN
jgi:nucleoid-associated protein YgaU